MFTNSKIGGAAYQLSTMLPLLITSERRLNVRGDLIE